MTNLPDLEKKICTIARWEKDPTSLRGLFTEMTRLHFSDPKNISSQDIPALQEYIWNPDETKSKIFIDVAGKFNTAVVEKRPAIFVSCEDFTWQRLMIQDKVDEVYLEGATDYQNQVTTVIRIFHVGTTIDEASILGRITAAYYRQFAQQLREELQFAKFHVARLSKPAILEEARERWVALVDIELAFFEAWQVPVESHKLKAIRFKLNNSV
jgi:hypothetical protein